MDSKEQVVYFTITEGIPILLAICNKCGVVFHFEFGMTEDEALVDVCNHVCFGEQ